MSYYSDPELAGLGLRSVGDNVRISRKTSIYGAERLSIGSNVRIDDFCILSAGAGGIEIGDHVHVAAFVSVIGAARIILSDFVGLSSRVAVYSSTDDFSGQVLTGPTVPDTFTNVRSQPVTIGRHVVVGAGSIVMPGVTLGDSCAIGALSLVTRDCAAFMIHAGNPIRPIRERTKEHLQLEQQLLKQERDGAA